jgi:hypothetical protein
LTALARTPEWRNPDPKTFRDEIIPRDRPAILRGIVADWPAVQAGRTSPQALLDYIRARDLGKPVETYIGTPEIGGRFHFRDDMSGLNFERGGHPIGATTASIIAQAGNPNPPAIYAPAVSAFEYLPQFAQENRLALVEPSTVPRLWMGNGITTPTHYDMNDGIACVVAGRKRFTLFPPEQLPNLYIGPLDMGPGGRPTSMVRVSDPDFARFPKFRDALAAAEVAELEPGDAVFIPNLWWHNVESLDPVNLLVNFWWFDAGKGVASPFAALALALMAIKELPESRRRAWRQVFDHYVFQTNGDPVPYLPPDKRGILGDMNPKLESYMRGEVLKSVAAGLPKHLAEQVLRLVRESQQGEKP